MNEQWRKKTKKEIVDMLSNVDTYTIDDVEYKILSKNDVKILRFNHYPYTIYNIDYRNYKLIPIKNMVEIKRKRSDCIFLVNMAEYEAWYDHSKIDNIINTNRKQKQEPNGEEIDFMPVVPEYHVNRPLDNKGDIVEIYGLKYHKLDEDQKKFIHTNECESDIAKSRYNIYWYNVNDKGDYTISNITSIHDEDKSTIEDYNIGEYAVLVEQYEKFLFSYGLYNERIRLDKEREEVRKETYEEYRAKREAIFEDFKSDESVKGKFSDQELNAIARYIQILNDEDEEDETAEISLDSNVWETELTNLSVYTDSISDNMKKYIDNKIKENLNSEMSEDVEESDIEDHDDENETKEDIRKYKVFAQILNIIPANMIERCLGVPNLHVAPNNNEDYFLILKSDSPMYYFISAKYRLDEDERFFKCNNTYITNPLGALGSKVFSGDILLYKVRIPYKDKSILYDIIDLLYKGHPMFINISTLRLLGSVSNSKLTNTIAIASYFNHDYNETIKFAESYGDEDYEYGFPVLDEDTIDEILGDDIELGTIYPMQTIPIRNNTKIFVKTSYGTFINGNGTEFTPGDLLG